MSAPGVPQPRKKATSGFNPTNASATGTGPGKGAYKRKSAQPFGSVKRSDVLPRRVAGVSPSAQPVGDKDAGNNGYRKNNTSGQNMSKLKKGAD